MDLLVLPFILLGISLSGRRKVYRADDWRGLIGSAMLWASSFGIVSTLAEVIPIWARLIVYTFFLVVGIMIYEGIILKGKYSRYR